MKNFAIFRRFRLNLGVFNASADGASEWFRVFYRGKAYDVIIFQFQGVFAPPPCPLLTPMRGGRWRDSSENFWVFCGKTACDIIVSKIQGELQLLVQYFAWLDWLHFLQWRPGYGRLAWLDTRLKQTPAVRLLWTFHRRHRRRLYTDLGLINTPRVSGQWAKTTTSWAPAGLQFENDNVTYCSPTEHPKIFALAIYPLKFDLKQRKKKNAKYFGLRLGRTQNGHFFSGAPKNCQLFRCWWFCPPLEKFLRAPHNSILYVALCNLLVKVTTWLIFCLSRWHLKRLKQKTSFLPFYCSNVK